MGCLNSSENDGIVSEGNANKYRGKQGIKAGVGKSGQGVSELKQNYVISKHS